MTPSRDAPGLDLQTIAQPIDRLMMPAVYFSQPVLRGAVMAERLDIMFSLVRQIVPRDVELERPAERDVENLQTFADGQDRKTSGQGIFDRGKFPAIPLWIDIFIEHRRIGNLLPHKFRRDIGAAGQKKAVHLFQWHIAAQSVPNFDLRVLFEKRLKIFFILFSQPGREIGHGY